MRRVPAPQAAWALDGSARSALGGTTLTLQRTCNWTEGHKDGTRALVIDRTCFATALHSSSLAFGASSISICARLRSFNRGTRLISKMSNDGYISRGLSVELGDYRGLGIGFADAAGVSTHEELGRSDLADGKWHHTCAILQRKPRQVLSVYVDGRLSESLNL